MAKGYWIARVDVSDMEAYQEYVRANAAPFAEFNARFLVRGGEHEVPEGLDWNQWLGPAAARAYHPAYLPFNWRGYSAFGSGCIGDWICHVLDPSYWALGATASLTGSSVTSTGSLTWATSSCTSTTTRRT